MGGLPANVGRLVRGALDSGSDVAVAVKVSPTHDRADNDHYVEHAPTFRDLARLTRGADVVHMHGFWLSAAMVALLLRTPLVWTHYEYDTDCPIGIGWFRGASRSFAPATCVRCIAERQGPLAIPRRLASFATRRVLSHFVARNIQPNTYIARRLSLPRTQIVRYGVPPPPTPSEVEQPTAGPPAFGYFGRLIDIKGCTVLLDAAALCARRGLDFRVVFVGKGDDGDSLRARARELELVGCVEFEDALDVEQVSARMRHLRAVVVPSLWDENGAIVILEAMAAGVPVIASRVGGNSEYLAGIGVLVTRGSAEELADAIQRLSEDKALHHRLASAGRGRVAQEYSAALASQIHTRLYQEVILTRK